MTHKSEVAAYDHPRIQGLPQEGLNQAGCAGISVVPDSGPKAPDIYFNIQSLRRRAARPALEALKGGNLLSNPSFLIR